MIAADLPQVINHLTDTTKTKTLLTNVLEYGTVGSEEKIVFQMAIFILAMGKTLLTWEIQITFTTTTMTNWIKTETEKYVRTFSASGYLMGIVIRIRKTIIHFVLP